MDRYPVSQLDINDIFNYDSTYIILNTFQSYINNWGVEVIVFHCREVKTGITKDVTLPYAGYVYYIGEAL